MNHSLVRPLAHGERERRVLASARYHTALEKIPGCSRSFPIPPVTGRTQRVSSSSFCQNITVRNKCCSYHKGISVSEVLMPTCRKTTPTRGCLPQVHSKEMTLKAQQLGFVFLFQQLYLPPLAPPSPVNEHLFLAAEVPQLQTIISYTLLCFLHSNWRVPVHQ